MNEYGLFHLLPLPQYVCQSIQAVTRRRTEIGHHNSTVVRIVFFCCQQFVLTIVRLNFLMGMGLGGGREGGREGTKASLGTVGLLNLLCH